MSFPSPSLRSLPQEVIAALVTHPVRQKRYSRPFRPNAGQFQVSLDQRDRGETEMLARTGVGDEVVGVGVHVVIVMLPSALAIHRRPPTPLDWWDADTSFHCRQHGAREDRNTHGSPSAMSSR